MATWKRRWTRPRRSSPAGPGSRREDRPPDHVPGPAALPRRPERGAGRDRAAVLRRLLRHLRARQRGRSRPSLYESPELLRYRLARNEQAMVHTASGFARMRNRLQTFACTSSVGPGATNMVTGAALATINRLPVLLLPGDVFASRRPDPVLQQ